MSERTNWSKESWRNFKALQQPNWPDARELETALATISGLPPLVFAGEIRDLKQQLAKVARGEAFLLQGGDCAESFSYCNAPTVRELLKVILQMTVILGYAGGKPVVKVGRMAGQYAKPRSADTEMVDGVELPSYRGDMVNSSEPEAEARRPDPQRMVKGYFLACATMNILRAFTRGGYAALDRVHAWNNEFVKNSPQGQMYERLASQIERAINFMRVVGLDTSMPQLTQASFFTSHEALLLGYEESLTRQDSTTGDWYDCSAHMLWIGERTRQVDGAHVEFFRGVHNPIGVKIGPNHDIDDVKRLVSTLNPDNEPGKLTLITRFGIKKIAEGLTPLVRSLKEEGFNLVWSCDPMHGNTYTSSTGLKTRNFVNILEEIRAFFEIHWQEGTVPGGVHFEMTGADVTECVGGGRDIMDQQLSRNYQTMCDPRLNAEQSLELAFQIAELLREK
ncbi:class II 3-deoxy-7-phosphoheptulonate synthase [Desulfurivibrio dismutans]|uniref:class II 3-deoxy-7-phosphoheptulonate synthase n=1 Tax=Desulfurivibrio dismutans TaxID=1398908 RepID=UPI0023DB7616|nr:3-deoxy-7-phosphoheptulonate synthase class II [Desulfurivibrio alkaliphilus]MDF1613960.1 3-deoxy-7-phosphoheptulonate synthase class II [Desulfurivibrio alkaliphilus]